MGTLSKLIKVTLIPNFKTGQLILRYSFLAFLYSMLLSTAFAQRPFYGGTPTDYLAGKFWGPNWKLRNPLEVMRANGFELIRMGATVHNIQDLEEYYPLWSNLQWRNEFWSSMQYCTQIFREAQEHGFRLNFFFFFSHTAAHGGQQIPPPEWDGLSVEVTADTLYQHCKKTVKFFKSRGINIEYYDMGNEITRGILGFRPGERVKRPAEVDELRDMDYMRNEIWSKLVIMLKKAIQGVREEDPEAKIVIHTDGPARSPLRERSFYQYMVEQELDFDFVAVSWYPISLEAQYPTPSEYAHPDTLEAFVDFIEQRGKKVIISEFAYPSYDAGLGEPLPNYPFTEQGQLDYVSDFLSRFSKHSNVEGLIYFYPDWFPAQTDPPIGLGAAGLFQDDRNPKLAMSAFQRDLPTAGELTVTVLGNEVVPAAGDSIVVSFTALPNDSLSDSRLPLVITSQNSDSVESYILLTKDAQNPLHFSTVIPIRLATNDYEDAIGISQNNQLLIRTLNNSVSTLVTFDSDEKPGYRIQGIDFDSFWSGGLNSYVADNIDSMMTDNINWVKYSPTWWMPNFKSTEIRPMPSTWSEGQPGITISDVDLEQLIDLCYSRGLKFFLEPTVNVDNYSWIGAISPTDWTSWFENYTSFITHYARLAEAKQVGLFSIGNDIRSSEQTLFWLDVIDSVSTYFSGPLTYSSSGFIYQQGLNQFWDRLDLIGVRFPIAATNELNPTVLEMERGMSASIYSDLQPFHARYGKPVIVTQIGIFNVDGANQMPWFFDANTAVQDNQEQADYYEAALQAMAAIPWLEGMFWWRWELKNEFEYNRDDVPFTLNPKGKPAEQKLREYFVAKNITSVSENLGADVRIRDFTIHQNYPNPFNPTTSIRYELSKATEVTIKIFNILGQTVVTLIDENQNAGGYQVHWNGKNDLDQNVTSGIYLLNFSTSTISKTRKMLLIR